MMRWRMGVVTAAAVGLGALPWSVTGAEAATGDHVVVKDVASGSTIVTHRGDRLVVKLTACETCGYRWKITNRPDPQVEPFLERRPSVQQCESPCTGGNAVERFVFAARHSGRTSVTFGYFGPGKDTPSETRHLRLVVRHRSAA